MCNDCGEIKNNKCGCRTKVDLKCTFYDGSTLEPLHILNGMTGEEIVVIINNYLKDLILELEPEPTILQNVGTGAELYKGFTEDRRHEIKTLLEGEGITLTETDNSIEIKVSQEFIENITGFNVESVGTGTPVYIGEEDNTHKFRELTSSDSTVIITIDEDNQINLTAETNNSDKLDKTTTTIQAPDSTFKYAYITDEDNNTRRMLAGDLGKNIANSSLTSVTGAGMTQGDSYTWSTAGNSLAITGLVDKTMFNGYHNMLLQNEAGDTGYADYRNLFVNLPKTMTLQQRNDWIANMNVDIANSYLQLLTVIDGDFIVGNNNPIITIYGMNVGRLADLADVKVELIAPDGNPVPNEMFEVVSFSVNSNSELVISFSFDPSYTYITGEYKIVIINNLIVIGEVHVMAYTSFAITEFSPAEIEIQNNGFQTAQYSGGSANVSSSVNGASVKINSINPLPSNQDFDINYTISSQYVVQQLGAGSQTRYINFTTGFSYDKNAVFLGANSVVISQHLGHLTGGTNRIVQGAFSQLGYTVEGTSSIVLKMVLSKRGNTYKVTIYRADNNQFLYTGRLVNTNNNLVYFYSMFNRNGYEQSISTSFTGLQIKTYS